MATNAAARASVALLDDGINVSVMRLPQVHDTAKQGLITPYIAMSRKKGALGYVGAGANRWPAAHISDVARLYALAIARGEPGARYHAVAEEGISARAIAEVLAERLGLPAVSVAPDQAEATFGWFAMFAGLDMAASGAQTRAKLGWTPTGPDLLTDLRNLTI